MANLHRELSTTSSLNKWKIPQVGVDVVLLNKVVVDSNVSGVPGAIRLSGGLQIEVAILGMVAFLQERSTLCPGEALDRVDLGVLINVS